MSSVNPNRYPVDYTGKAATNLIINEQVNLTTLKRRVFIPKQAPYFGNSMTIIDNATGKTLTSSQWKTFSLVAAASTRTDIGYEVYIGTVITDQSVSNNLTISYQTVGGDYITGFDNINALLGDLTADTRPVTWPNVLDQPANFPANQHYHTLSQTFGWEYFVSFLEQLKLTIILGDIVSKDSVLAYIDAALNNSNAYAASQLSANSTFGQHVNNTNNPHNVTAAQLGLGNIQNYPVATQAQAFAGTSGQLYITDDLVQAVVKNTVNGGMDAHVARTDNPHAVTAAQIGLGFVQNYPPATLTDLNNPDQANPKYVTNVVLGSYVATAAANLNQTIANSFTNVTKAVSDASANATQANSVASDALNAAQLAVQKNTSALAVAQQALTLANANKLSIDNASSTVSTLFDTYVAQAVEAARQDSYAKGYAAGLAAR